MAKPPGCPICGKHAPDKFRPFCSLRCSEVDLGRWFGEAYRIPAAPPPEEEVDEAGD